MINVNELIKKTIKKEIFSNSEISNKSARLVLSELKTKFVDVKSPVTSEIQYKILKKMETERIKDIDIYSKTNNALGVFNLNKEKEELKVIQYLMKELEIYLPKMLDEIAIREFFKMIIENNDNVKIGDIMKEFKNINADKAIVSKITKEMLEVKK